MLFGIKKSTISWAGSILMLAGAAMMIVWGAMSIGHRDESVVTPYSPTPTLASVSPTPTKEPDLLIPTRTPAVIIDAGEKIQSMTPTIEVSLSPVPSKVAPTATQTEIASTVISKPSATPTLELPLATKAETTPTVSPPEIEESATPGSVSTPSQSFQIPKSERHRIGVSLPFGVTRDYNLEELGVGWIMDWNTNANPPQPAGIKYAQTVRMRNGTLHPDASVLGAIAASQPGSTWLISNEPDVRWQDNITPEKYARLYHDAYYAITSSDPTAIVAAGGIAQPSQLRFDYLDLVLSAYKSTYGSAMPLQAWQIHNYMLREERNTWGVDIPPGISANQGVLYSIDDSGNIAAFKAQIYSFRRWMASRGYTNVPLIVSEFGIPMPPDYGFGFNRVSDFLRETMIFFNTATDSAIGYPADGGRLVQQWCWFSLGVEKYPSGNLLHPPDGEWTPLGLVWRDMVE